jgi:hypothetical protein
LGSRASGRSEARFCHALFGVSATAQSTAKAAWFPTYHQTTSFDVDTNAAIFDADAISFFVGGCMEKELQCQSKILQTYNLVLHMDLGNIIPFMSFSLS